jgi:nicotinamidase-related amidase
VQIIRLSLTSGREWANASDSGNVLHVDHQHGGARTDFEIFLGVSRVDTLLVCGTSVSGCVRATVTDAFMRDIRCMVVRECVADRAAAVAEANLFDMDQKYADVISLSAALDYLNTFSSKSRRAGS